ncbi:hypothetical protein ACHAXH_004105 [Discostella pseudostelligera]
MATSRSRATQHGNATLLLLLVVSIVAFIENGSVAAAAAAAAAAAGGSSQNHHRQHDMTAAVGVGNTILTRGGGGGASSTLPARQMTNSTSKSSSLATSTSSHSLHNDLKAQTLNTLLQTSFLITASVSMVMFSPLPSITRHLAKNINNNNLMESSSNIEHYPEARAIQILSILSSTSASIELLLSPFVGSLIDSPTLGRKRSSVILHACIACANLCVVLHPGVVSICLSRMVNVVAGGFLVIVTNTVIADVFAPSISTSRSSSGSSSTSEQMGSVLGKQAAFASFGFLLGSVVGGRLTEYGERVAYGTACLLSVLATANVLFRMEESLTFGKSRKNEENEEVDVILPSLNDGYWEKPLSSVRLFYQYGSHMRTLALLLLLQSAPMFMGDVFQMFAKEEWSLHPKDFSNLVASSLIFPLTTIVTNSYRHVLASACLGMLAGVQKLGTSAAMTSLASELGVPQGRLQGEKASMLALLKIGCPIVYGMLYLKGSAWKSSAMEAAAAGGGGDRVAVWLDVIMSKIGRKLPFVLNVILGICAFGVSWQNL